MIALLPRLAALTVGLTLMNGSGSYAQSLTAIPPSELSSQASPLVRAAAQAGDLHVLSYHDVAEIGRAHV